MNKQKGGGIFARRGAVLTIANQKGGVGKTTTAVTLGAALTRMGKKVLLVDLDPHANASVHLRYYPEELEGTSNDLFLCEDQDLNLLWERIRYHHAGQCLDVVPATIRLAELEIDLRQRPNKGVILRRALDHVAPEYDFILLDCPPHVGILLVNALVAADLLLIPIQTDFLALHGLKLLFDTIKVLNKILPKNIPYRVLPTLFDRRAKACSRVLDMLSLKMQENMFKTVIGMDTRFREASAQGRVIYDIAPESKGAKAYEDLAREIVCL